MVEYDYVKTRREDVRPIEENQVPFVRFLMRWVTRLNVAVFRASKGRLMNKFIGDYPVCIVTTTGANSGKTRRIVSFRPGKYRIRHGDIAVRADNSRSGNHVAEALPLVTKRD